MAKHPYSAERCELDHAGDVPKRVLDALPENQGHPVRHRCAACAYLAGVRDGRIQHGSEPTERELYWACRLLLLMVAELHLRGYEQLRIAPYMAPSGMYWRCGLVPRRRTSARHGAMIADGGEELTYSSSGAYKYFGWDDCAHTNPIDLADRFERTFPELLNDSRGTDTAYTEWYRSMLRETEPLGIVSAFADDQDACDRLSVFGESRGVRDIPVPPAVAVD